MKKVIRGEDCVHGTREAAQTRLGGPIAQQQLLNSDSITRGLLSAWTPEKYVFTGFLFHPASRSTSEWTKWSVARLSAPEGS